MANGSNWDGCVGSDEFLSPGVDLNAAQGCIYIWSYQPPTFQLEINMRLLEEVFKYVKARSPSSALLPFFWGERSPC